MGFLVFSGQLDMVDHNGFDRRFGGLKLEAELFVESGKDGGRC